LEQLVAEGQSFALLCSGFLDVPLRIQVQQVSRTVKASPG
jgi:hypothetical protein